MSFLHHSDFVAIPLPNYFTSTFFYHQPQFLLLLKHSKHHVMWVWIPFINPRMHAGHTKLYDPINIHMTTNRSASVICELSALWLLWLQLAVCHVTVMFIIACHWCKIWWLRRQKRLLVVHCLLLKCSKFFLYSSMLKKRGDLRLWNISTSHYSTALWALLPAVWQDHNLLTSCNVK